MTERNEEAARKTPGRSPATQQPRELGYPHVAKRVIAGADLDGHVRKQRYAGGVMELSRGAGRNPHPHR